MMTTLVLGAWMLRALLSVALIGVSVLLIGLVLLQKNRGSGLSGAFGGVGGHTAFGTRTGDVMTWITVSLTAMFLLLSIAAVYAYEPEKIVEEPKVATPAAAEPVGTDATPAGTDAAPAAGSTPTGAAQTIAIPAATEKPAETPAEKKTESTPPPPAGSE